jgi:UDP-N-acetylmuramoyl-tripeptide--D-alanyl-D-alanine ligase
MMVRTLSSVAAVVEGRLLGPDASFAAVCTDTRRDVRDGLFVALRGARFDGNDYVAAAAEGGAAGALVGVAADVSLPQVVVADTRRALGIMAARWRANFSIPIVAVTGSSGKTTVKGLVASIFGVKHRVCATVGNLNNDIGVPLTLMRLDDRHDAAVIELGANHAGEIDYLAAIVVPEIAIITNAGPAHLEGFGSVAGVAAAKGELLDHICAGGAAVLNADDAFWSDWTRRARRHRVVSFGFDERADCRIVEKPRLTPTSSLFRMRLPSGEEIDIELPLPGIHNVRNALAAAAAAHAHGIEIADIRSGLETAAAVTGRLVPIQGKRGARIIDDSYNANPSSARAALDYLAALSGRRIFVLGDMAELGGDAIALHREIGEYARGKCDELIGLGELGREAVIGYGRGARDAAGLEDAAAAIEAELDSTVTVVVKGSRVMGLERLVRQLRAENGAHEC